MVYKAREDEKLVSMANDLLKRGIPWDRRSLIGSTPFIYRAVIFALGKRYEVIMRS